MELTSESDQRLTCFRLNICGINHCEASSSESLPRYEVQHLERIFCSRLSILVVRYKTTAEVGREYFGGLEMCPSEAGLSASRGADQDNQGELRDRDLHRLKTPICVGAPT